MLTRQRIVEEIERAIRDEEPASVKWFAEDALTSEEGWEHGAENLIGEVLHALVEWGEPNWPMTGEDAWEIAGILKRTRDPEEALDEVLLLFGEPRFEAARSFRLRRFRGQRQRRMGDLFRTDR